VEEATAALPPA